MSTVQKDAPDAKLRKNIQKTVFACTLNILRPTERVKLTLDTDLYRDFTFDSLDCLDLMMRLESEFGIDIPDADVEKLKGNFTVKNIVEYIYERRKAMTKTPQKVKWGRVQLHMPDARTVQFSQNNTLLDLKHPKVAPIIKRIRQELAKQR